jgi:cytochrome b6-f complex subunit 8
LFAAKIFQKKHKAIASRELDLPSHKNVTFKKKLLATYDLITAPNHCKRTEKRMIEIKEFLFLIVVKYTNRYNLKIMDILSLGWYGVLGMFTLSIAFVVWGRNGL